MTLADTVRLFALAAIWGSSFLFMRILVPELGAFATAELRLAIAGIFLFVYFRAIGFDPDWKRHGRAYFIVGAINTAIPFSLFCYAAYHIPAAYSAIFNSTSPIFGAVFAAIWLGERLTARKITGLLVGTCGVALVARVGAVTIGGQFVLASLACLGAAMCYGIGGIYIKKYGKGPTPLGISGASQMAGALLLLPFLLAAPPARLPDAGLTLHLLVLGVVCSAIAYILYYRLVPDVGPSRALTVTFLVPIFGMIYGALFLGEHISAEAVVGAGLVVLGTTITLRK